MLKLTDLLYRQSIFFNSFSLDFIWKLFLLSKQQEENENALKCNLIYLKKTQQQNTMKTEKFNFSSAFPSI